MGFFKKGQTWGELFGPEKAALLKAAASERLKEYRESADYKPPKGNKGPSGIKWTEERRAKGSCPKGFKQSPEQIAKRVASRKATMERRKAEAEKREDVSSAPRKKSSPPTKT